MDRRLNVICLIMLMIVDVQNVSEIQIQTVLPYFKTKSNSNSACATVITGYIWENNQHCIDC